MDRNFNDKALCTCSRCRRLFSYSGIGFKICQGCKEIDDKEFNAVKEYIYANETATIKDTTAATGVKISRIRAYLRDGRLIIPDHSPIFLNCEKCGASIKYGRFCKGCADSLTNEIKKELHFEEYQVGEKPQKSANGRFRFLDLNPSAEEQ